jgi:hypothetical protein
MGTCNAFVAVAVTMDSESQHLGTQHDAAASLSLTVAKHDTTGLLTLPA